jgi:hypothetical protein
VAFFMSLFSKHYVKLVLKPALYFSSQSGISYFRGLI